MAPPVTLEELRLFHTIDRILFARLVLSLRRDPAQSMQVIAFYLWVEQVGFDNIIYKMLKLPHTLVNAIADEAVTCLNFLERGGEFPPPTTPGSVDIPLIHFLVGRRDISLQFLHERRLSALAGITRNVNSVCIKAFDDILQRALRNPVWQQQPPPPVVAQEGGGSRGSATMEDQGGVGNFMMIPRGGIMPFGEGSSSSRSAQEGMERPMARVPATYFQPMVGPDVGRDYLGPYFRRGVGIYPSVAYPSTEMGEEANGSRLMPTYDPNYAEIQQQQQQIHQQQFIPVVHDPRNNPETQQQMPMVYAQIEQQPLQGNVDFANPRQQMYQFWPNDYDGSENQQQQQQVFQNFPGEEEDRQYIEMQEQMSQLLLSEDPLDHNDQNPQPNSEASNENLIPGTEPQAPHNEVPQDERTLFITFSRGYQLSETEVRDFFTRNYGDCIESLYMQDVPSRNVQPLFARVVIRSASILGEILEGSEKAKFAINGKHVWVRLYVPRRHNTWPPPPAAPTEGASTSGGGSSGN